MANCVTLTAGRKLPCKGGAGGIKAVSFTPFSENLIVGLQGEVASIPSSIDNIFRYELKNTGNTFIEEIATDEDSRTVIYNGTLSIVLNKMDLHSRNELKMMTMGELIVFIETYNNQIFVVGAESGASISGGSIAETGGAKTDFFGSKLTFSYSDSSPYLQLSTSAKAEYSLVIVDDILPAS